MSNRHSMLHFKSKTASRWLRMLWWKKIRCVRCRIVYLTCLCLYELWAPAGMFLKGQNHQHSKCWHVFWRAVQKIDHFSASLKRKRKLLRFLRRFRLKYRVSMASSEGASKNFRVFVGRQQGCQILVTFHAQTRQISSSNRNFQVQTLILRIFALKIHSNISTFITFLFEIIVPSRK